MLVELKWTALKDFQSVIRESAYARGNIKIIPLSKDLHQRWANLDQASKHLEVFRFRDLSPTPKP
jgi:hypothetical protein